jgi:hypothetical protein
VIATEKIAISPLLFLVMKYKIKYQFSPPYLCLIEVKKKSFDLIPANISEKLN